MDLVQVQTQPELEIIQIVNWVICLMTKLWIGLEIEKNNKFKYKYNPPPERLGDFFYPKI
jgi:hypothetical protein